MASAAAEAESLGLISASEMEANSAVGGRNCWMESLFTLQSSPRDFNLLILKQLHRKLDGAARVPALLLPGVKTKSFTLKNSNVFLTIDDFKFPSKLLQRAVLFVKV